MSSFIQKNLCLCLLALLCFGTSGLEAAEWTLMESPVSVTLKSVWGTSTENVYAVGSDAAVVYFNGSDWTEVDLPESVTDNLLGIHGSSSSNIVVVGLDGTILKYDGSSWSVASSGVSYNLNGVWVNSESEFYIAAESGKVLKCDEFQCVERFTDFNDSLNAIWGTSSSNIYAVGGNGAILHNDGGSQWEELESPTEENLNAIWGTSADNIFAVGNRGTIIHFNGTSWSDRSVGTSRDFNDLGGTTAPNIYTVGDELKIYNYSTTWTNMASSISDDIDPITNLSGVWVSQTNDAFAVGEKGTILLLSENISAQNTPPTAVLSVTPDSAEIGETFFADSSDSFDAQDDQSVLEHSLDWGDGTAKTEFSTATIASHEYSANGTYTITLEVRDTGGLTGTATAQVVVGTGVPDDPDDPSNCPAQQLIDDEESLEIMRRFRDEVLDSNSAGRALVRAYYRNGGSIAEMLDQSPALSETARIILKAVVPMMKLAVQ